MAVNYIVPGSLLLVNKTPLTEPVTLSEVKSYLHVGYDDDDLLITDLIIAAREWAEQYTSTSIVPKEVTLTACMQSVYTGLELPYGPITDDSVTVFPISVTDPEQSQADKVTTGPFKRIKGLCGTFDVTYTTGFIAVPKGLKMAILAKVAASYENRGDQDKTNYAQIAKMYAKPYKRAVWL